MYGLYRKLVIGAFFVPAAIFMAVMVFSTASTQASVVDTVSATVTSDSRDINEQPAAPVAYEFAGAERTGFADGVFTTSAITEVSLNSAGEIVFPMSWADTAIITAAVGAMIGAFSFVVFMLLGEDLLADLRRRERSALRMRELHRPTPARASYRVCRISVSG